MSPKLAARILARRKQFSTIAAPATAVAPLLYIPKPIGLDPTFVDQNNFILDPSQFIDAQCSRRAGKSSGLAIRFFNTMDKFPGKTCIYLSLTAESAKEIMWPVIEELKEKYGLPHRLVESKLTVYHPNGAKLRLYGADMKNFIRRLKGKKSPGIAIDEAQDFGSHLKELIDDVLTPMMADFGEEAWLAVCGTPGPIPMGYFFEITQQRKHGFSHHEWTLLKNPYIPNPEGFVARLIERKKWAEDHPTLLREYRNKWVLDLESLWIRYKQDLNHFEELPKNVKQWHYILGVDIGWRDSDAFAVLAHSDHGPETYLVREIVVAKQDITGLRENIEMLRKEFSFHKMVIDTGGLGKKIAEELKNRYGIPLEAADKTRKQENAEFLNDALRIGTLKAHKDSRFAKDSYLIQIDWDKSSPDKIVVKKSPHSDIIDAVLYAFKESPAYAYAKPADKIVPGSEADFKRQEELHIQSAIDQVNKTKQLENGQSPYGTWTKDKKGVPDWNKW